MRLCVLLLLDFIIQWYKEKASALEILELFLSHNLIGYEVKPQSNCRWLGLPPIFLLYRTFQNFSSLHDY